jgi:hypothetical protein
LTFNDEIEIFDLHFCLGNVNKKYGFNY